VMLQLPRVAGASPRGTCTVRGALAGKIAAGRDGKVTNAS